MDQSDGDVKVQYVRSASTSGQQSSHLDSLARQSILRCVNGDNVVIITDDVEDIDGHLALWRCTYCSSTNPVSVAQCISCLAFQKPGSQLVEDAEHGEKKSSGAEDGREIAAMDVDIDDEGWVCRRCTLQNVAESIRCQVCEAPRRSINFHNGTVDSAGDKHRQPADANRKVNVHGMGDNNKKVLGSDVGVQVSKSDSATADALVKDGRKNSDWAVWTCNSCTYNNNPSWSNICDVCETVKGTGMKQAGTGKANSSTTLSQRAVKVATSWSCERCSLVNDNSVRDCTCCGALRTTADNASTQDMWTCTKCTLQNNNVAHVCAACLSKRNTVLPQIDNSDTKWPCPRCTYINRSDQHSCQACGHHKHASSNYYNSNRQVPGESKSNITRQRSVFVKERQVKEETAAHDQWMQIVNFCTVVSRHLYTVFCKTCSTGKHLPPSNSSSRYFGVQARL